uniref:Uncharacterized protein n=1 Tax=Amphiprion percula TaxID=161767 RepID=A0A3P8SIY6_AMPPE
MLQDQDYHSECIFHGVKHRGGSVIMWACISANSVGEIPFIDGAVNYWGYTEILADNIIPTLQQLRKRGIIQHNRLVN